MTLDRIDAGMRTLLALIDAGHEQYVPLLERLDDERADLAQRGNRVAAIRARLEQREAA